MKTKRVLATGLFAILWIAAFAPAASAAERVRIMVGGIEKILYLPAKLAEQLGYYKDEGLDVELISVNSGSVSETSLLSHTAEAAVGAYEQSIHLQAKGKFVTSIVQMSATPQEALLVSTAQGEHVKSPADLRGKVIGVTGFGSLTYYLTQDLLTRSGLKPGDVSFISAGAGNTFISAMQQGRIDAGMTQEPTVSILLKSHRAKVLVDLRTPDDARAALGGDYPGSAVYVRRDWLKTHKDTAKKLAHAFVRALRFIATHSAEEIAAKMPPSYYKNDKDLYVQALASSRGCFTKDGKMPADGPQTVLDVLTKFGRGITPGKINLSKTYTNEFVAQVGSSDAAK